MSTSKDQHGPSPAVVGYKMGPNYVEVASFGGHHGAIQDLFDFAEQWELARYLEPQGPLRIEDLPIVKLASWKKVIEKGRKSISDCLDEECSSIKNRPVRQSKAFWHQYRSVRKYGDETSEAAFDKLGTLVYRARIEKTQGGDLRVKLAPAIIGASRRLWRHYPSQRLVRVSVAVELDWLITGTKPVKEGQATGFRRYFEEVFLRELRILDGRFKLFYKKPGSNAYLLWSESSSTNRYASKTLSAFYNDLIPQENAFNAKLSLSKYSARLSLWLSRTVAVQKPDEIRWTPDLTNHTVGIRYSEMKRIAKKLGLSYVPTTIFGDVYGTSYTWCRYYDSKLLAKSDKLLCLYGKTLDPMLDFVEITFSVYKGLARDLKTYEMMYGREELDCTLSKPEGEPQVMTDGCAIMSCRLAQAICDAGDLVRIPSAAQARCGGAKGLWVLNPDPNLEDDRAWIEIRDSQYKCAVDERWLTFEVVRVSLMGKSPNLGENMARVLRQAQTDPEVQRAIHDRIEALTPTGTEGEDPTWDGSRDDPAALLAYLDDKGRAPQKSTTTRCSSTTMQDCSYIRLGDVEEEDEDLASGTGRSDDIVSGYPRRAEDRLIELLQSGFDATDALFRHDLRLVKAGILKNKGKARIPLDNARHLFVAADMWDCLPRSPEDNAVFCQLSESTVDTQTKRQRPAILKGPVLLNRSPCVQPCDIQQCHAVDSAFLSPLFDIVIIPARGERSILSLLSGGDLDGDTVNIVFDGPLAKPWKNDRQKADPPASNSKFFKPATYELERFKVEKVADLTIAVKEMEAAEVDITTSLQRIMCGPGLLPSAFGRLSNLHTKLAEIKGIRDDFVSAVGFLYTESLDAAKAGQCFTLSETSTEQLWDRLASDMKELGLNTFTSSSVSTLKSAGCKRSATDDVHPGATVMESRSSPGKGPQTANYGNAEHVFRNLSLAKSSSSLFQTGSASPTLKQTFIPLPKVKAGYEVAQHGNAILAKSRSAPAGLSSLAAAAVIHRPESKLQLDDPDYLDLWLSMCASHEYAKELLNDAQKTFDQMAGHFKICDDNRGRVVSEERAAIVRAALEKEFAGIINDFWSRTEELLAVSPFKHVPENLSRRHIIAALLYFVASIRTGHSARQRLDFVLGLGWKWILDIKAEAISEKLSGPHQGARRLPSDVLNMHRPISRPALRAPLAVTRSYAAESSSSSSPVKRRMEIEAQDPPWTPNKKQARRMEAASPGQDSDISPLKKKGLSYDSDEYSDCFADDMTTEAWEELEEISELRLFQARMNDSGIGTALSSQEVQAQESVSDK